MNSKPEHLNGFSTPNRLPPISDINEFALQQAESAAAKLWAFGSAPFPFTNPIIQRHIESVVTDTVIAFAIHCRRLLDNKCIGTKFALDKPFRIWSPEHGLTKVADLRDALNYIVHSTQFEVGFERLPDNAANIVGGAIGVIYLRARTDQRKEALIDVFALASCFFGRVLPAMQQSSDPSNWERVH